MSSLCLSLVCVGSQGLEVKWSLSHSTAKSFHILFSFSAETNLDILLNELRMHLYCTYCVLLYTQSQSASQSCGGGGLSSTTTSVQHPLGCWMMRRLPQDNDTSVLSTHQQRHKAVILFPQNDVLEAARSHSVQLRIEKFKAIDAYIVH